MEPNEILENVRQLIADHSAGDPDKWWYACRRRGRNLECGDPAPLCLSRSDGFRRPPSP